MYRDPVDLGVARFVGEAVVLECKFDGEHAETVLGRLAIRGDVPPGTTGTVMLRPEQIRCDEPAAGGPRGQVLSTRFYGRDAMARISIEASSATSRVEVTARTPGQVLPEVGDAVSLVVDGSGSAYPAQEADPDA